MGEREEDGEIVGRSCKLLKQGFYVRFTALQKHQTRVRIFHGSFPTSMLGIGPRTSALFATALPTALLRRVWGKEGEWIF